MNVLKNKIFKDMNILIECIPNIEICDENNKYIKINNNLYNLKSKPNKSI